MSTVLTVTNMLIHNALMIQKWKKRNAHIIRCKDCQEKLDLTKGPEEYSTSSNSKSESSRDDGTNNDNFDEQEPTMEEVNLIPSDSELPDMKEVPSTPLTIKMEDIKDTQTKENTIENEDKQCPEKGNHIPQGNSTHTIDA